MSKKYILGIDEGTTSVRTVLFNTKTNNIENIEKIKFKQYFPKPGWVEHNPEEIWKATLNTLNNTIKKNNLTGDDIYGIAITNQRETTIAWNKDTTISPCHAIVWQCRRTAKYCNKIKNKSDIKNRTGLIVDSYFSATKMKWLIDNVPEVKLLNKHKKLCLGTIDSYLIYKLTNGKSFYTDITNASRTMLYNINTLSWDEKLLKQFGINIDSLPQVKSCNYNFGNAETIIGEIPILSVMGDQQASLFGEGCFDLGMAKNTYGTGCFILLNIGNKLGTSNSKLLNTIAWQIDDKVTYALEGSVFNAGSTLEWGNKLGLFEDVKETANMAYNLETNDDIYFVPAFSGLGAPYWDPDAKGTITGITGGTSKAHLTRALLESMAYSTYDIIKTMSNNKIDIKELRVDGGVANNDFLLQFQSDITNTKILRQESVETTVLGTIYMAGLNCGVYKNLKEISNLVKFKTEFNPKMKLSETKKYIDGWHKAVKKCLYNG